MAYDFPASPTPGQVFQGWTYDGEKWVSTMVTPNQSGVIGIQVFTSSGTYTPSPSMTTCVIECVGGGGSGGGAAGAASQLYTGGGGGSGGYSQKMATAAQIGASQTVTIGAGGAATAAAANSGNTGGDTSVGTMCIAKGGLGGLPGASGQVPGGGSGAIAGTGDVALTGGPGGNGLFNASNNTIATLGGVGGSSRFGGGSIGGSNSAGPAAATGRGGGGGGAYVTAAGGGVGGAGGPGLVVITEYGMTALSTSTAQLGSVRYDLPQGLTTNQMAQARSNIAVTKRNYIINGAMQVSQENGATAGTGDGYHPTDMFRQGSLVTLVTTVQQIASVTPAGSSNRVRLTCTGTDAAPAATHYWFIRTYVEGLRAVDLRSGTASAKTITIQFGVKAPAGTYYVSVQNAAQTRSYPASYVIAAGEANTDVIKSVTISLDTTGTWVTDNTAGMYIFWPLASGTNNVGVANTWQAGSFLCGPSQFNIMTPAGNIFELFDVSLTEGSVAPPFQLPDYISELALCQRYYRRTVGTANAEPSLYSYGATSALIGASITFPVPMRGTPTITKTGSWAVGGCAQPTMAAADNASYTAYSTVTSTGVATFQPNGSGIVYFNVRL